jgi:predicted phosphohydrolase
MRIAVTADLHRGLSRRGDAATRALAEAVARLAPDVVDVGEGEAFAPCLLQFAALECPRLVLPGNHDLWTCSRSVSSLDLYERSLPELAEAAGFQYLDQQPFLSPDGRLAIVGSINWYDYSFADPALAGELPDVEAMYRAKLFPNGCHNDGRFVRLGMSDAAFTGLLVERFTAQLADLPPEVEEVVAIQHHPPVRELFYPSALTTVEQRVWLAYTGNRQMEAAVRADPRIRWVLCGHTHAACEATVAGKRCFNVGGDYDWKALVLLDTTAAVAERMEFQG